MGQVYQCWWRICQKITFIQVSITHVLYPFVTYLLTLPHTKEKTIAVQVIGFLHKILVFVIDAKLCTECGISFSMQTDSSSWNFGGGGTFYHHLNLLNYFKYIKPVLTHPTLLKLIL
jgi:hypothetical protein